MPQLALSISPACLHCRVWGVGERPGSQLVRQEPADAASLGADSGPGTFGEVLGHMGASVGIVRMEETRPTSHPKGGGLGEGRATQEQCS